MRSNESAEMYLETILLLTERTSKVRAIDIAHETGYSKPSVSRAMKLLKEGERIRIDDDGYILLTEQGRLIATKIVERHRCLTEFLRLLGVSEDVASEDACRMEHIISDLTFEKMKDFLNQNKQ
ncbi:MAG: metal-dependent transcriptional regulator [Ruminococcaceae bacterium]|nr:metal-dependent transcriptional regulator [Oscillospiraceae bacterium]